MSPPLPFAFIALFGLILLVVAMVWVWLALGVRRTGWRFGLGVISVQISAVAVLWAVRAMTFQMR